MKMRARRRRVDAEARVSSRVSADRTCSPWGTTP